MLQRIREPRVLLRILLRRPTKAEQEKRRRIQLEHKYVQRKRALARLPAMRAQESKTEEREKRSAGAVAERLRVIQLAKAVEDVAAIPILAELVFGGSR